MGGAVIENTCKKWIGVVYRSEPRGRFLSGRMENDFYYVLELVCSSIFPYPEPSITAHIAELLWPIAWVGQNYPMKFEQKAHYATEHMHAICYSIVS